MLFSLGTKRPKFILPHLSSDSDSSSSTEDVSEDDRPIPHPAQADAPTGPKETTKSPFKHQLPKIPKISRLSAADLSVYREDFPHLKNKPDDYFAHRTFDQLIRMNTMLEKSNKSSRKLTEKLARNLDYTKQHPVPIHAGTDNRSDILHDARFLGGHVCKHTDIWLRARNLLGLQGPDPVSRYDTETLGLTGHINSYLWSALSNPGSKDISITMASPEALKAARGVEDRDGGHPKKDFTTISDFRMALAALRVARHCIHPWDFSLATIEFFLISVQFGETDLPDLSARLRFLSEFVDEALQHNAEAWDDAKSFLPASALSTRWMNRIMLLRGTQPTPSGHTFTPRPKPPPRGQFVGQPTHQPAKPKFKFEKLAVPHDVCRRFNLGQCSKQADPHCFAVWDLSKQLRHVCCFRDPTTQAFCLKPHSLMDHK